MAPDAFWAESQVSRDYMIAYHIDEKRRCSGCGTKPEEWDPETGGSRTAYEASARVCFGCRQIEQHQASKQAEAKKQPLILRGLKFFLKPRKDS